MLDKLANFLKNTFTYEEESKAEPPKVVKTASKPKNDSGEIKTVRAAQPTVSAPAEDIRPQTKYTTTPQDAAQQQTNNFAALRPKPEDTQFRMLVDKVFYAKGGGVVVRGQIGVGIAKAGSLALIVHAANRTTTKTKVVAIERDGKVVGSAPAGSTVGLLLERSTTRNDVHIGDVIGEIS